MTHPSARAPTPLHPFSERAVRADLRKRAEQRQKERDEFDTQVIEVVRKRGQAYCIEVLDELRLAHTRINKAKGCLVRLEKQGRLTSEIICSPKSGLGRRYYRIP